MYFWVCVVYMSTCAKDVYICAFVWAHVKQVCAACACKMSISSLTLLLNLKIF